MNADDESKKAVDELGEAINSAIEKSPKVLDAVKRLREIDSERTLILRLEISLNELLERFSESRQAESELDLTDDDLRTLDRMKIKV